VDDWIDEAIVRSLRFATRGPLAGHVVRALDSPHGSDVLVTSNIFCDNPLKPSQVVWYSMSDLRTPTEMEVIGAMAL
jgi:hypothetical protein